MKKLSFNQISASIVFAFLLCATASSAEATTIVNSVSSQSVTGGQKAVSGQDGKDGQNGKNGEDGKKGEDGQSIFSSDAGASVHVKSVIDGVTVFDSNTVPTENIGVPLVVEEKIATTSVDNYSVSVQGTAKGEVAAESGDLNYRQIQEILTTIRLMLMSYVSKLF